METTNACSAFNTSGKVEDSRSRVTKMAGKCGKYDKSIFSVEFLCLVRPLCLEHLLSSTILPHSMSECLYGSCWCGYHHCKVGMSL